MKHVSGNSHRVFPVSLWLVLLAGWVAAVSTGAATTTLVPAGSDWKYEASGTDLGTAWSQPVYNDSAWSSGPAQLGYGDGDEATKIPASPVRSCYYFRHAFEVTDPGVFTSLSLEVLRDDGAVVYLNGVEVARYNMPAGPITYGTWASSASEYGWDAAQEIANHLVAGPNVIAVEVHQGNSTSSDLSLDLRLTGISQIAVTPVSPADGSTDVATPATLTAMASDPEGGSLTVSFIGRQAPPPVPEFSIVVLPDTQFYTDEINGGVNEMFVAQTQWILDNRAARNIAYVAHVGDISNNGDRYVDEWLNATEALYRLESPLAGLPHGIPYGLAVGNHDQIVPTGDTEPTTYYNQYFGVSRFQGRSYYGGSFGSNNNNHYQVFSASGLDFIVIYLEYDTSPDAAVLDWADALLKANPARRGIVVSHYLLETTAAWGQPGLAIYEALRDNPNLFLMLCGHNHAEARRTDVYAGNTVHTLLADFQSYPGGGNGFLRILTFSPDTGRIRVQTYSPWLNQYETDSGSEFALDYPMTGLEGFTLVQQPAVAPSGATATATWSGLKPGTTYEWYVAASDGTETVASGVRRFTTAMNNPPSVTLLSPVDGATCDVAEPVSLAAMAADTDGTVARVDFYLNGTWIGQALAGQSLEGLFEIQWTSVAGWYAVTAVATDNGGAQTVSAPVYITVGGAPAKPVALTATAQSPTEILLTWTDAAVNEAGFEVWQSVNGDPGTLVGTIGPDVSSAWITGLQPGTTYTYVVRAFNAAGHADSDPASATTPVPPPPPAAPSALTASPLSDTAVLLTWTDNSTDETGFLVERSPDGAAWQTAGSLPAGTTTAQDTGLVPGTVWHYRVRACSAAGCSEPSPTAVAAPFIYALANGEVSVSSTVSGTFAATHAADGVFEVLTEKLSGGKPAVRYSVLEHKWTLSVTPGAVVRLFVTAHQTASSDGDQFVIAWSTDDLNYQDVVTVSGTVPGAPAIEAELPASLQGTVYLRVRDTNRTAGRTALDSLWVDQILIRTEMTTSPAPPAAPTLTAATPGDATVSLAWTASAGASTYTVKRRLAGSTLLAEPVASGLTGTAWTDTGVQNGTAYTYVIVAVNSHGESANSNEMTATPVSASQPPAPPTGLTATGAKRKITLAWTQSVTSGITGNRVYRSADGASFTLLATLAPATSYSDAVPSGTTYTYRVTAVSAVGESAPSNTATATAK